MNAPHLTDVLAVGATGSVGQLVMAESIRRGHRTRALVRDHHRAASLPATRRPSSGTSRGPTPWPRR